MVESVPIEEGILFLSAVKTPTETLGWLVDGIGNTPTYALMRRLTRLAVKVAGDGSLLFRADFWTRLLVEAFGHLGGT